MESSWTDGASQGLASDAALISTGTSRRDGLPRYSVASFNQAIGNLLERGFAPVS